MTAKRKIAKIAGKGKPLPTDKAERGAPVIRRTLNATLHELARSGYAALKVEDIAEQASVNKTTIYRRWPTKEALVRAALLSISHQQSELIPDTGSVQEDLLLLSRRTLARMRSPEGQVTMRMVAAEHPDSELGRIAESLRREHDGPFLAVLERARERHQLRVDVEPTLVLDVLGSACLQRVVRTGKLEESFMKRLLKLLLEGASSTSERPRAAASRAPRRRSL